MDDHRMNRGVRFVATTAGAVVLGFLLVWSFLAYRDPDMVISFASLLQLCGIALTR